jgi:hypothetical protein
MAYYLFGRGDLTEKEGNPADLIFYHEDTKTQRKMLKHF